jgi:tetratricopeptide (TPR) repeat protein
MIDQRTNDEPSVILRLLEQFMADRETNTVRTSEEYQALFPGHERAVKRELASLESGIDESWMIDEYRILEELASGGQGVVYLADDPMLPRRVALKVLRGLVNPPPDVLLRFQREAELLARVDHPCVCPIYASGVSGGAPWIAMKYVDGETLERFIAKERTRGVLPRSRREIDDRVKIVSQLAAAVGALHAIGVTHRDVKPRNVMLARDGRPVLLDFGIAHVDDSSLTSSGEPLGAPLYMSPEQSRGEPTHHTTDVWALGALLYECLAPEAPFLRPSTAAVKEAIQSGEYTPLGRVNRSVPRDLCTIVATALDSSPARRYRNAQAMADDLQAYLERRPIAARPAGPLLRALRWCQRHPVRAVTSAAAALLVTVGALAVRGVLIEAEHAAHKRHAAALAAVEEAYVELLQDGASVTQARTRLEEASHELRDTPELLAGRLIVCLRTMQPQDARSEIDRERGGAHDDVLDVFDTYLTDHDALARLEVGSASQGFALGAVSLYHGHLMTQAREVEPARDAYVVASRSLEAALHLEPSPPTLHRLLLLQAAQYAERHDLARATARGLNMLVPDSAAVALLARGDAAAAVSKSGDFAWARRMLARDLSARGDHLAAVSHLEHVTAVDPESSRSHYELGLAYVAIVGDSALQAKGPLTGLPDPLAAAVASLSNAYELDPSDQEIANALALAKSQLDQRRAGG